MVRAAGDLNAEDAEDTEKRAGKALRLAVLRGAWVRGFANWWFARLDKGWFVFVPTAVSALLRSP